MRSEEGYMEALRANQPPQIGDILMQQSAALTTLVAHLANQDGIGDLGGSSSSSSAISLKLDLGSLRAGGASWLLLTSEDSELTRRRGRWIAHKVMEVYVQEISSPQFLPRLPERIGIQILSGAALFPWSLAKAMMYFQAFIPASVWYVLFKNEAVYDPPTAEQDWEPKRCRKEWVEVSSMACQSCPVHRAASMEPKRVQSVKS
jgi:hypothetical protein